MLKSESRRKTSKIMEKNKSDDKYNLIKQKLASEKEADNKLKSEMSDMKKEQKDLKRKMLETEDWAEDNEKEIRNLRKAVNHKKENSEQREEEIREYFRDKRKI
jgi:septal ring factor EnvC (AmiA/AmiB activator)